MHFTIKVVLYYQQWIPGTIFSPMVFIVYFPYMGVIPLFTEDTVYPRLELQINTYAISIGYLILIIYSLDFPKNMNAMLGYFPFVLNISWTVQNILPIPYNVWDTQTGVFTSSYQVFSIPIKMGSDTLSKACWC